MARDKVMNTVYNLKFEAWIFTFMFLKQLRPGLKMRYCKQQKFYNYNQ